MNISNEKDCDNHSTVLVGSKQVPINHNGYLLNFDDWGEDFSNTMAKRDHLELKECHWEAINFLRGFYREYEVPPSPRTVIKAIGDKINSWGCTNKDFENAFPLGGCKQACRLAGLPFHYCHAC